MRGNKLGPTSPLGIFLDRVMRGDLKGLQYLWVFLIFGIPLAGLIWLQILYGSYILTGLYWIFISALALLALTVVVLLSRLGFRKLRDFINVRAEIKQEARAKAKEKDKQASKNKNPANVFQRVWNSFRAAAFNLRVKIKEKRVTRPKIVKPPGTRLFRLVEFFYSEKMVEELFKPLFGEWHHEYFKALEQKRQFKAYWVSIRHRIGFFKAIIKQKVLSFVRSLMSAGK